MAALFTVSKTQKQAKCAPIDKWIRQRERVCVCVCVCVLWNIIQPWKKIMPLATASVRFSRSVVSDSSRSHESQHARPRPSPTPGVYSNSCPSSPWCHPAISSSVVPFSSCPQSLPASGSFPMSQLFAWGGQSIGVSALASVLPMNTQDWSPLGWTGWTLGEPKGHYTKQLSVEFSRQEYWSG